MSADTPAQRQPVFVNPLVPAGILGALAAPLFDGGLTRLSNLAQRPAGETLFQMPSDPFNPFGPQGFAQFADAGKAAAPVPSVNDVQVKAEPAVPTRTEPANSVVVGDCVELPKSKMLAKPKPKAVVASPFAARVSEGKGRFSEQVQQSRKAFQVPAKVRPAIARNC